MWKRQNFLRTVRFSETCILFTFILNDIDHTAINYWSTDTYPETAAALQLVAISTTQLREAVNRWQFSGISGQPDI